MNTATEFDVVDVAPATEVRPVTPVASHHQVVSAQVAETADLLRIAIERGATLEQIEKIMDLQERREAKDAKRAYDAAFAAFKAEAITILKGRKVTDGPLKGKSYAELHDIVNAVTPALSKHGLSSSWKLTKDERDWMEVTCFLRHVNGHQESVSMGGPPDSGGAKNAIQARASTKTYLERYTLKAITGLSEQDDDNDGRGAPRSSESQATLDKWLKKAKAAMSAAELEKVWKDGIKEIRTTKDMGLYDEFKALVEHKGADFKAAEQTK